MKTTSAQRIIPVLTSRIGVILLVALVASALTGHYQQSVTEAAKVDLNPAGSSSAPDAATRARNTEAFGKLPLSFEANKGQTDQSVKFLSRSVQHNGSIITGDVRKIIVVQTNPGYGPSPGHWGTAQVIAVLCSSP